MKAKAFYLRCMAKGGALPSFERKQEKNKGEICMKWFNAVATADEKATLKPPLTGKPDEGARRRLVDKLHGLIVARLTAAFDATANIEVPRDLQKDNYELPAAGIVTHLDKLKSARAESIDTTTLAAWRAAHEQQVREAGVTGSGGRPTKKAKR